MTEVCSDGSISYIYTKNVCGIINITYTFKEPTLDNSGFGYIIVNDIAKYHGHILGGYPNGHGLERYFNGDKQYEGEFLNGLYHGQGKLYGSGGGLVFEGKFELGKWVR